MIDYRSARAALFVRKTGSFEKAARALNVTPSAVSQQVKQLELRMGVALIVRGDPCFATEKGETLFRHLENIGILENELGAQLPELFDPAAVTEPVTIAIGADPEILGSWMLEAIASFTQTSGYLVNMVAPDDVQGIELLRSGQAVAAITSGDEVIEGHRATPIGWLHWIAVASPDYAKRHFPIGVTIEAISTAPALTLSESRHLTSEWVRFALGQEVPFLAHKIPSSNAILEAASRGMGWSVNPIHTAREHLKSGELIELVPGIKLITPLQWQVRGFAVPALEPLTDSVLKLAKRDLVAE
ncbi:hypothetical protein AJ87_07240 [Rhizobium yanglingense]|nr:hypothetical protein AJ87_07240 [Rhizobium yanglingense]